MNKKIMAMVSIVVIAIIIIFSIFIFTSESDKHITSELKKYSITSEDVSTLSNTFEQYRISELIIIPINETHGKNYIYNESSKEFEPIEDLMLEITTLRYANITEEYHLSLTVNDRANPNRINCGLYLFDETEEAKDLFLDIKNYEESNHINNSAINSVIEKDEKFGEESFYFIIDVDVSNIDYPSTIPSEWKYSHDYNSTDITFRISNIICRMSCAGEDYLLAADFARIVEQKINDNIS